MSSSISHDGFRNFTSASTMSANIRVKRDSSGYAAIAGVDVAGIGTACDSVLTSGDVVAVNLFNRPGSRTMVAAGAITAGVDVFAAASGKVSATPEGAFIGTALETASGDGAEIEVMCGEVCDKGLKYANIADSSTVTNTVTETDFDKSLSIAANDLKVGDVFDIEATVLCTNTNSTDTLTLKLKIGSVVLVTTAAVDVATNDIGHIRATMIVRAIGASGSVAAMGTQGLGVPGTVTAKPFNTAPQTVDTTAANVLKVSATWSVASSSNVANLENLVIVKR